MNKFLINISVVFLYVNIIGCSAFGVPLTFNPDRKLQQAEWLFDKESRPLPAESLILEAIDIYKKKNDEVGLANAYRIYAFF